MKVFITKYALTQGILEVEAEPSQGGWPPNRVGYVLPEGIFTQYARKGEWHENRASAVARAEEMRLSAIASLKKNLAKLEQLTFTE